MTVGFSLLDHLEHLLGAADEPLRGPLHVDHLVLVLVNSQVDLGCCREKLIRLNVGLRDNYTYDLGDL